MSPKAGSSQGGRAPLRGRVGRRFLATGLLVVLLMGAGLPASAAAEPTDAAQTEAPEAEAERLRQEEAAKAEAEKKQAEEAARKAEEEAARKEAARKEAEEEAARKAAEEEAERQRKLDEVTDAHQRYAGRLGAADAALTQAAWSLNGTTRERVELEALIEAAAARKAAAREQVDAAGAALTAADGELAEQEGALAAEAVAAYRYSDDQQARLMLLESLVHARSPADFVTGLTYLEGVLGDRAASLASARERQAQARVDLTEAEEQAEVAEREHQAAAERLPELQAREAGSRDTLAAARSRQAGAVSAAASFAAAYAGEDEEIAGAAAKIAALAEDSRRLAATTLAAADRSAEGAAGPIPWDDASCPITGSVRFINDWGFPRSGGRSHEGTDVFAARGKPIVAMTDAVVKRVVRADVGLGGRSVTYEVDGYRVYNAHLDEVASGLQAGDEVRKGQVLGTVGTSGNARSTPPHNHVGLYQGRQALNPYPMLALACGAERGAVDAEVPPSSSSRPKGSSL